jgi:jasmonic acid-amino synthetase
MLTRDAGRVQQETLKKILEMNADAEYLTRFGLDGRTDAESYRSCIPLCVHSDVEPFIKRVAEGDSAPVLTGKTITSLSLRYLLPSSLSSCCCSMKLDVCNLFFVLLCSSGTTQGKPKFIPFNDELLENTLQVCRTSYAFRNR